MSRDTYPECSNCGQPLDGDYHVRRHVIENPIERGRWNPLTPDTWVQLAFGDGEAYIERTCGECKPSEEPPEPTRDRHLAHLGLFFAGVTVATTATGSGAFVFGLVCVLGALGECVQLGKIDGAEGEVETETRPREKYLAGEITEEELEAQLEDELDEDREETQVVER